MKLDEFYADPRRESSREVDFGSAWYLNGKGPWRVVWLEGTGELVAFNEGRSYGPNPHTNLLEDLAIGFVKRPHEDDEARKAADAGWDDVTCLLIEPDYTRLCSSVSGWAEHMTQPDGLAWLGERCRSHHQ